MAIRHRRRVLAAVLSSAALVLTGQQAAVAAGAAPTTTNLVTTYSTVSATVGWTAPLIAPTGSVTFSVGGHRVGTVPVPPVDPTKKSHIVKVTLHYHVHNGATRRVTATYGGDTLFAGSTKTILRRDPTIGAKITSKVHKTRYHWYRAPVTVTFHCVAHGSPLSCPKAVHLTTNGLAYSVTGRTQAGNGGRASVTVRHINIDRTKPKLKVKRSGTHLRCDVTDSLSGVASCAIHRFTSNGVKRYRAVATDKAGNRRVVTGRV